jgi:hypothetical protein
MKKILALLFLIIYSCLLVDLPVEAESLTVSATVDTALTLQGYTSPISLVTFTENSVTTGTVMSDSSGLFEREFNNQDPGIHAINIYSTDPDNTTTLTVSFQVLLIKNQSITVSDIYLPPTINLDDSNYYTNEEINVDGYSKPSSLIQIEFTGTNGDLDTKQSNSNGYYTLTKAASELGMGSYQVTSTLQVDLSTTSTESESLTFTILSTSTPTPTPTTNADPTSTPGPTSIIATATPTPEPSPTITLTPTPVACPYNYINLCFFDTEKVGSIEIEEPAFVNYLIEFVKNFGKPIFLTVDLNNDQSVDASDLSIFLYHVKTGQDRVLGVSFEKDKETPTVLGLSSQRLDYPYTIVNNKLMSFFENPFIKIIINLLLIEVIVGIPFFLVFLFLIFINKRRGK